MQLLNISAIAVALAMDAFAVAIATGVTLKTVSARQTFRLSWHFGLFQALMPIMGWAAGIHIRDLVHHYAPWVAFGLLLWVGSSMIRSALNGEDEQRKGRDPTRGMTMVMLSIATSIDALAVGISLSMLDVSIWTPAVVIGLVACGFTIAGMHLGKTLAKATRLGLWAEGIGGVVLIGIGLNILREYGFLPFI